MNTRPARPPRAILIAIAILLAFGVVSWPLIQALVPEQQLQRSILLYAAPFIAFFVAIILAFVYFIVWLALRYNGKIPMRLYRPMELVIMAGIVIGVVAMFQPWAIEIYQYGFLLLLFSTLAFTAWSHVIPRYTNFDDDTQQEG